MASGYYKNCKSHMDTAGLRIAEVASAARVHEQSVRRCRSARDPSSDLTIRRIINAINTLHYSNNGGAIDFEVEFLPKSEKT